MTGDNSVKTPLPALDGYPRQDASRWHYPAWRGSPGGWCRLRVWQEPALTRLVAVVTDLGDANPGVSVTNAAEYIHAELRRKYGTLVLFEHYPADPASTSPYARQEPGLLGADRVRARRMGAGVAARGVPARVPHAPGVVGNVRAADQRRAGAAVTDNADAMVEAVLDVLAPKTDQAHLTALGFDLAATLAEVRLPVILLIGDREALMPTDAQLRDLAERIVTRIRTATAAAWQPRPGGVEERPVRGGLTGVISPSARHPGEWGWSIQDRHSAGRGAEILATGEADGSADGAKAAVDAWENHNA